MFTEWFNEISIFDNPPLAVLLISIIQLVFYFRLQNENENIEHEYDFDPEHRDYFLTMFSYLLIHHKGFHVVSNVIVQFLLGVPLEFGYSWWRVAIVYLSGVFSCAIASSIFSPNMRLVGAFPGEFALLFACLPSLVLILNHGGWRRREGLAQLIAFVTCFAFITITVGINPIHNISYIGNAFACIAGCLTSIVFLDNSRIRKVMVEIRMGLKWIVAIILILALLWGILQFKFELKPRRDY